MKVDMANQWFRLYSEFANDPKVQMLSEVDQRRLIMIYCLKCSGSLKNITDEELCFVLRITQISLQETKRNLLSKRLISEDWDIPSWNDRQFSSDSSNDRVKKYREKRKQSGLTCNGYMKHSEIVMNRDNRECVYCGSKKNLCIDHILPVSKDGNDDIENLAVACKECNSGKAGRTPEEAGMIFLNKKTEGLWSNWMLSRSVTVTVTPQNRTEQNRTEQILKKINKKEKFTAPTIDDVKSYIAEKNYTVNPEAFVNFYTSKNWMIGKNKMKCWKSAINTWQQNEKKSWNEHERRQANINSLDF